MLDDTWVIAFWCIWCITWGNPGILQPFDLEIVRAFHRLVRHSRNSFVGDSRIFVAFLVVIDSVDFMQSDYFGSDSEFHTKNNCLLVIICIICLKSFNKNLQSLKFHKKIWRLYWRFNKNLQSLKFHKKMLIRNNSNSNYPILKASNSHILNNYK